MRKSTSRKGFTITELLIVIVVIGILATITLVQYNGTQARGRDVARMKTLDDISTALEMYYDDNHQYPAIQDGSGIESSCGSQTDNWGHCDRMKALSDALAPYLNISPASLSSATTGSSYYFYYNSASNDKYQHYGLMVYLEDTTVNDGGYYANAYELGENPMYCMNQYNSTSANWRWSASSTRCQGGN